MDCFSVLTAKYDCLGNAQGNLYPVARLEYPCFSLSWSSTHLKFTHSSDFSCISCKIFLRFLVAYLVKSSEIFGLNVPFPNSDQPRTNLK